MMRLFIACLLAAFCVTGNASADDRPYVEQIGPHLNRRALSPEELKNRETEVAVTLSVSRAGKLLDAKIDKGSGSPQADAKILQWLNDMQPYPPIPQSIAAPWTSSIVLVFAPTPSPVSAPSQDDRNVNRAMRNICKGC
jgi:TonB family protein